LDSIEKNPFVGEPHLVLAQVYHNMERYEEAGAEAEEGLKLLLEWGIHQLGQKDDMESLRVLGQGDAGQGK
jgi:hypothetical protein